MKTKMVCDQVDSAAADEMDLNESNDTKQLDLGNAVQDEDAEWIQRCMANEGKDAFDSLPREDQISENAQNVINLDPQEKIKEYAISIKQLRHQPIEVAIERLFIQGEFKEFTKVYGEHDGYYFQSLCTSWDSIEDYNWIEALYVGRFILMLPHPAYAVFLFRQPNQVVPESKNAWALAKRCSLDPKILDMRWVVCMMKRFCPKDGAIFHGNVPLNQFHETRSAEEWRSFTNGLMFLYVWWHQPEAPWLEGCNMKTATVALAREEERIAYRNSEDGAVLNTVKDFFEKYGLLIEYSERPEIIRNFVELVMHYPNLKWRLARILHDATAKAGYPTEIIEALRYNHGPEQYTQQYFAWKRSMASKSDKGKKMYAKIGEMRLLPFQI